MKKNLKNYQQAKIASGWYQEVENVHNVYNELMIRAYVDLGMRDFCGVTEISHLFFQTYVRRSHIVNLFFYFVSMHRQLDRFWPDTTRESKAPGPTRPDPQVYGANRERFS